MKPHLILGLTLTTASACPGDTATETGDTTGTPFTSTSSPDDTTGTPPTTDPETTAPTSTTSPTSTSTSTTDATTGTSTTVDPSTTTTGDPSTGSETSSGTDTTADTGTSTGTTTGTSTGTTADDTTSGTSTGTTSDTDTDTDTDTTTGGMDDEIYDVQDGTLPAASPVDIQGVIVTAIATTKSGFFAQEQDGGQFSGAWVFVGANGPDITMLAVGDEVNITGVTEEFNGLTEINASMGAVVETGVSGVILDPMVLPIATFTDPVLAEPWEAVHVAVAGAPLDVAMLLPGEEFQVADGGTAVIDNLAFSVIANPADFPSFGVDASFTQIAGPLNFSANTYKIVPRTAADLEGYMPPANPKLGVEMLVAGDLIVTEVMYNPSCANDDCEWIEIYNNAAQPIELLGLIIQDNAQNPNAQGKVSTSAVIDPGTYAVLAYKTMVTWPYPTPPLAFYGSNPALTNGVNGDTVYLKNTMITIDKTAAYVGKGGDQGVSWKLDPTKIDAAANDVAANWCYSNAVFFMMEKGSPAAANEPECSMP